MRRFFVFCDRRNAGSRILATPGRPSADTADVRGINIDVELHGGGNDDVTRRLPFRHVPILSEIFSRARLPRLVPTAMFLIFSWLLFGCVGLWVFVWWCSDSRV